MHKGLWRVFSSISCTLASFHTKAVFSRTESAEFEMLRSFFIICMRNLPLLSQQKGNKRMINTETPTKVINPFQKWHTYCFFNAMCSLSVPLSLMFSRNIEL